MFQLRPEICWNVVLEVGDVRLDFFDRSGAGDDGCDGRVSKRKLKGCRLKRNVVTVTDRFDSANTFQNIFGCIAVVVFGAFDRACG